MKLLVTTPLLFAAIIAVLITVLGGWHRFWPGAAAGLVAFLVGVPIAYFLLRHQWSYERGRDRARERSMAKEALRDVSIMEADLENARGCFERHEHLTEPAPRMRFTDIEVDFYRLTVDRTAVDAFDEARQALGRVRGPIGLYATLGDAEESFEQAQRCAKESLERARDAIRRSREAFEKHR